MLNALNIDNNTTNKIYTNEKIINVENLSFKYSSNKEILKNINFSINYGDFACIIGKNGCGKSTLLKLLLGLIKFPNSSIHIKTTYVSYIPQSLNFNRSFPITVKEFLKYYTKELKIPYSTTQYLIERYNLGNCLNSLIGNLSGGQLQKLILVRALLKKTDLLIVDEPTNNLDEESTYTIYNNLKTLNNENMTILVVEHNKNIINNYANKIFKIDEGILHAI